MGSYKLTHKAVEDLNAIWHYTYDDWSEDQADRYYTQLLKGCQYAADFPSSGKAYPKIMTGLRGYKVERHILFYRQVQADEIEVIRILHEMMDLPNRIQD